MASNADNYKATKTCRCRCNCISVETENFEPRRSTKRKLEGTSNDHASYTVAEKEDEILTLKDELRRQHEALDEERKASASAVSEAMAMINRLQKEKAEVEMRAKHFTLFAEHKISNYEQKLIHMKCQLDKKDDEIRDLEWLLKKELIENVHSGGFDQSKEITKCSQIAAPDNIRDEQCDIDTDDAVQQTTINAIEKSLLNGNLSLCKCIQTLEDRLQEMEKTGCNHHLNNEWVATRKVLQKMVTAYSASLREEATVSSAEKVLSSNYYVESERMSDVSDISTSALPSIDDVTDRKSGLGNQSVDVPMQPRADSANPQEDPSIFSAIKRYKSYILRKNRPVQQAKEKDGVCSQNVGLLSLFDKEPTGRLSACKIVGVPAESSRADTNPALKWDEDDAL